MSCPPPVLAWGGVSTPQSDHLLQLLHCLVISLDHTQRVSFVERHLRHLSDPGQHWVGVVVAGVHLGLDDECLAHIQYLGVHQRISSLLASLDNVTNSNNSTIHDIIILTTENIQEA